jgi:cytoplasmic iron level regulating protein YaaA (DUF328/UPF0246 family)
MNSAKNVMFKEGNMELILVVCSNAKIKGGTPGYKNSTLVNTISQKTYLKLLECRKELLKISELKEVKPGPDLGFEGNQQDILYLPAFQRYDGLVYQRSNLRSLKNNGKNKQIIIVSALYGILDSADFIQNYELNMDEPLPSGTRVNTWWKNRHL